MLVWMSIKIRLPLHLLMRAVNGEVRVYGKIANDLGQIDKVMRKLISQNCELHCVYEAGPCGTRFTDT
jgi:division protein CdvB (Snf7/Vps24/ESCRT-III family)